MATRNAVGVSLGGDKKNLLEPIRATIIPAILVEDYWEYRTELAKITYQEYEVAA